MKKLLVLMLSVIMALSMLVSCGESEIGNYEYPNYVPQYVPNITLDVHIIVGEGTEQLAIDSVSRQLSQFTETKFKTKLRMHYITEDEYQQTVKNDINKTGDTKADIILVNSAEFMYELVHGSMLEDLTTFYDGSDYGRLNTIITPNLVEASKIDGKFYSVPNDHVIGTYTYLLIDEAMASYYNFSPAKLAECRSLEDETIVAFKNALSADRRNFDDYVSVVNGDYDDRAQYIADGYVCNIVDYPEINAEEAFKSAFAVVKGTEYPARAMEIIYALNTSAEFRNLLQYGVAGVNYIKNDNGLIVPETEGAGVYNMNPLYTGSMFSLYYSDFWSETDKNVGLSQNQEAVIVQSEETEG